MTTPWHPLCQHCGQPMLLYRQSATYRTWYCACRPEALTYLNDHRILTMKSPDEGRPDEETT